MQHSQETVQQITNSYVCILCGDTIGMKDCQRPSCKNFLPQTPSTPLQEEVQDTVQDWEKEFDDKFIERHIWNESPIFYNVPFEDIEPIKQFIRSLLTQRSQSLREKIEGMNDETIKLYAKAIESRDYDAGNDHSLIIATRNDILKLIND